MVGVFLIKVITPKIAYYVCIFAWPNSFKYNILLLIKAKDMLCLLLSGGLLILFIYKRPIQKYSRVCKI